MEITAELRGRICILRPRGRFTLGTTEDFERSRAEARRYQPSAILIDLESVPYVDSTGIGYLLSFYTSSRRGGEQFGIVNVNERTLDVLRLCRLNKILPIFNSEAEAIAALGGARAARNATAD
jgi:anti-anti-sigma factor